jgi:hypothetical protein
MSHFYNLLLYCLYTHRLYVLMQKLKDLLLLIQTYFMLSPLMRVE